MRYAVRNIIRLKIRSLLTLAIAFAILFLAMFGVLVISLCEDNRTRFYGPLDGSVHVTNKNYEPYLTYNAALDIGDDADVITGVSAVKEYIGLFPDVSYIGYGTFKRTRYSGEPVTADRKSNYIMGIQIVGASSMSILEEVYGGDITMTAGKMFTDEDNTEHRQIIVISAELAEENGLSVGDEVMFDMASIYRTEYDLRFYSENGTEEKDIYTYTVGGIYQHRTDNTAAVSLPWDLNSNRVYVPISTLLGISESERIQALYHAEPLIVNGKEIENSEAIDEDPCLIPDSLYFHLSDMSVCKALSDEINAIGFKEKVLLTEFVSDMSSSPSARLSQIVSVILVGIVAVGFAIFLLAVLFNMKARHRELAVLVALGKKRSSVTFSFFFELAVLMLIALLISGGALVGMVSICAVPITQYLYSAELSARFVGENADMILYEDITGELATEHMEDFRFLFTEYTVPSFVFAALASVLLMVALFFFVGSYVKKINALSGVGGKE